MLRSSRLGVHHPERHSSRLSCIFIYGTRSIQKQDNWSYCMYSVLGQFSPLEAFIVTSHQFIRLSETSLVRIRDPCTNHVRQINRPHCCAQNNFPFNECDNFILQALSSLVVYLKTNNFAGPVGVKNFPLLAAGSSFLQDSSRNDRQLTKWHRAATFVPPDHSDNGKWRGGP